MEEGRTLTDADVTAIVNKLKSELLIDFYGEVGRGVWSWIKKTFWAFMLILAVYGMANSKVGSAPFFIGDRK